MHPAPPNSSPPVRRHRLALVGTVLAISLGYASVAWLCLQLSDWFGHVSPVWLATGIAVGALLHCGLRYWPAVFLGGFITETLVAHPWSTTLWMSAGTTLEGFVGAWLIATLPGRIALLDRFAVPTSVLLAAAIAPILAAINGALALWSAGFFPSTAMFNVGLTWWTGDAIGLLLVAPFFLPRESGESDSAGVRSAVRLTLVVILTLAASGTIFFVLRDTTWIFLTLPLILVSVGLHGSHGARVATLLISIVSVAASVSGNSGFAADSTLNTMLLLSVFLSVLGITALILPVIFTRENQRILPVLCLLAGWTFSTAMYAYFKRQRLAQEQDQFEQAVQQTQRAIIGRLDAYEPVLRGAAAALVSQQRIEPQEWADYVASLQPQRLLRGVQGIAVVRLVRPDSVPAETTAGPAARATGYLVTHAAPDEISSVIGRDLSQPPGLRTALEAARDSGGMRAARLLPPTPGPAPRPDFLLIAPVYDAAGGLQPTIERRRSACLGWVVAPIVLEQLLGNLESALDHDTDLHLFSGPSVDPANLIHRAVTRAKADLPDFEAVTRFHLGGMPVTAGWRRAGSLARGNASAEVWAGASFAFATLLLAGLIANLEGTRRRAARLAEERTVELEAANRRLRDQIVERTKAEAGLQRAKEAAEAASRAKDEFLAVVSHELRTPLNSVLGFAELLELSVRDPQQAGQVRLIRQSGESLLGLINNILDFSKIEAGRIELERVPFNLGDLAREVANSFSAKAREKRVLLEVDVPAHLPSSLLGDPARVRQVLVNLVGNAVKFTDHGAVKIALSWPVDQLGPGLAHVAVADSGPGIAAGDQAKLFQHFSQVDSSITRRFGGTGLGLAISRSLVELMGGKIGVISEPGHGSTFWFDLPLAIAPAAAVSPREPSGPAPGLAGTGLRVLVADDNEINQTVAQALLQSMGCQTACVSSGPAALEALRGNRFDALLLDCQMPGMDGYTAAREIRRLETLSGGARLPIFALTANARPADRQRGLDSGMDEYLTKPVKRQELDRLLRQVARLKATQAATPQSA